MKDSNQVMKQEVPINIGRRIGCIYFMCVCMCMGVLYILYMMIE